MNTAKPKHVGRNISCIRLLRVMQQEALAAAMDVKLNTVIQIEKSRNVDDTQLLKVAKALGISVDGIKNFSEEAVIDYISKTGRKIGSGTTDEVTDNTIVPNNEPDCKCNTLHKLVDCYTENKRLYERLLDSEREKLGYLEKLLNK